VELSSVTFSFVINIYEKFPAKIAQNLGFPRQSTQSQLQIVARYFEIYSPEINQEKLFSSRPECIPRCAAMKIE
jgi:hypothetical protein